MIDFIKWAKLSPAERCSYNKYLSETAAFSELGRRMGYLISVEKMSEAASIAVFVQLIQGLMEQQDLSFEDAIDRIWTEHAGIMDSMPVPLRDETDVHSAIGRGKKLLTDLLGK